MSPDAATGLRPTRAAARSAGLPADHPAEASAVPGAAAAPAGHRRRRHLAFAVLVLLVLLSVLVPALAPADLLTADLAVSRQPPSPSHWFGTDQAGHDLLVRCLQGLRVSLLIAVVSAVGAAAIGIVLGTLAASLGGWVDGLLMRLTDTVNALPQLMIGVVIVALFSGSIPALVAAVALTHWPAIARVVRAEAVVVAGSQWVDAARLAGLPRTRVWANHLLPAVARQTSTAVLVMVPHAVWHESTLSFLGLGLPPTAASLGVLLEQARGEVLIGNWWMLLFPAGLLIVATLAFGGLGRRGHSVRGASLATTGPPR